MVQTSLRVPDPALIEILEPTKPSSSLFPFPLPLPPSRFLFPAYEGKWKLSNPLPTSGIHSKPAIDSTIDTIGTGHSNMLFCFIIIWLALSVACVINHEIVYLDVSVDRFQQYCRPYYGIPSQIVHVLSVNMYGCPRIIHKCANHAPDHRHPFPNRRCRRKEARLLKRIIPPSRMQVPTS